MKTLVIFLLALVAATGSGFGQNLIAVQNGGEPKFYQQVDDAIVNAQDGDTIYIPGGSWKVSQPINKTLHIIGVGHNPAFIQVGVYTYLTGTIYLQQGCSHGSLTGFYISESIRNDSSNDTVTNFSISRCRIAGSMFLNYFFMGLISENVIEGQVANTFPSLPKNNLFSNNIFTSNVGYFGAGNNFKNNLFLSPDYTAWTFADCLFENNIIFSDRFVNPMSNCVFNNNLFVYNISFPIETNIGSKNIVDQNPSSVFVSQSGTAFKYDQNYQLVESSQGKNAGTDGTDVGIYGGIYPWKEGSIPFNPHFQEVKVSPQTDANGNLNVNIKVAAQER
jgi:hypothetical protein